MKPLNTCLFVAALATLGCAGLSGDQQGDDMKRCFQLVEGDVVTTLVVQDGDPSDSITVYERKGGADVVPPESAPGRITPQGFEYPDGTLLRIEGGRMTWPEKSLLPNAVFIEGDCP